MRSPIRRGAAKRRPQAGPSCGRTFTISKTAFVHTMGPPDARPVSQADRVELMAALCSFVALYDKRLESCFLDKNSCC
jgi:hypothetical protein